MSTPARLGLAAVLVLAMAAVLPAATGPFVAGGDHCEYAQMTDAFVNHGSPDLRPGDLDRLVRTCSEWHRLLDGVTATSPPQIGPYVRARDGRYYSWHFWGYSLAVVPAKLALRAFGADEQRAFPLVNGALFIGALVSIALASPLAASRRLALVALTAASPALWFVPWAHTEVFSASLVTIGLVLADRRRWALAAVAFAIASWQAPPLVALLAWCLVRAASDGRRSAIVATLLGGAVAVVPVAFSLIAYGTPSILAAHSSRLVLASPRKILELWVDPNIGMWMYAPVAVSLFAAAALWALLVRRAGAPAAQLLGVLIVMMALASTTLNWNHGTAGPSRYVIWMLPLVFYGVASLQPKPRSGWRKAYALGLIASVVAQAGILVALGGRAPHFGYLEHSPLARLVLRRAPALYNPTPEIFAERTRQQEEPSPFAVFFSRGGCRKALVAVRDLDLLKAVCSRVPDSATPRHHPGPPDTLIYVDFPRAMPVASATAREAAMKPSSLRAWLALIDGPCATPSCDVVKLDVSAQRVRRGDRLRVDVRLSPPAMAAGAELHVGVVLPDGRRRVRGLDGRMTASGIRHGLARAERSAVAGADGSSITVDIGSEIAAAGVYEVFAVLARAASTSGSEPDVRLGDVLAWAVESVVVTDGRTDAGVSPRNTRGG